MATIFTLSETPSDIQKSGHGILLSTIILLMLLVSCSKKEQGNDSWYKPVNEFVANHQELMQSNPDTMLLLVDGVKCGGDQELAKQWKRLVKARCYYLKGADDKCLAQVDSVNEYCKSHPSQASTIKVQAQADNMKGVVAQILERRDSALQYYEKAYGGIMRLQQREDAIDICINIADVSRQSGKLADASAWYRRANFLADSLHKHQAQNSILTGLGQVYNDLQNYQLAHFYFRKAERLYPPKNPKDAHFFYNSWGNVYSAQGKSKEALGCFRKAQKAALQIGQPYMTAIVDANLGQTYLELNQLDSAQKYLDRTYRYFCAKPDLQSDVQFYIDGLFAALAMRRGDLAKATEILSKPYDLSKMSPNYLYLYHKGLANLYERKGQYAKALAYQKLKNQYDDSLRNATMVSNVQENELRFKQDTAIVRRDVALQTAHIKARSSMIILLFIIILLIMGVMALFGYYRYKYLRHAHQHQQELKRMLALKMENVRNRFSPHFVFNVLNVFMSSLPKEVNVKPLKLLVQTLRTNLLTCDKITASLDEELQMVMSYANLRHETNPFLPIPRLDIGKGVDTSLLLPSMIIQIPVENALKHAFVEMQQDTETPQLDIKIWMEDRMLRINVIDNGCGNSIGNAEIRKKASAVSTGTGLRILNSTIEMLNAGNDKKIYFKMCSRHRGDNEASESGTLVDIVVPCDYDYDIFK